MCGKFLTIVSLALAWLPLSAQEYKPNLPWADISGQKERQVEVAADHGSPGRRCYHGLRVVGWSWRKGGVHRFQL